MSSVPLPNDKDSRTTSSLSFSSSSLADELCLAVRQSTGPLGAGTALHLRPRAQPLDGCLHLFERGRLALCPEEGRHQGTRNRFGTFGSGTGIPAADQPRSSHASSFGHAFGNPTTTWNGGIWGNNTAIGSGLKNTINDNVRSPGKPCPIPGGRTLKLMGKSLDERSAVTNTGEVLTGSGSLLSTSESDDWSARSRSQWASMDNTSPGLSSTTTRRSGTSPMRRQNSNQQAPQSYSDLISPNASNFLIPGSNHLPTKTSQNYSSDSNSFLPTRTFEMNPPPRASRQNSDEDDYYAARSVALAAQPHRQSSHDDASGFGSSVPSRNGSLPPSRNGVDPLPQFDEGAPNAMYPHVNGSSSASNPYRTKLSAQAFAFSRNSSNHTQRFGDLTNAADINNMTGNVGMMALEKDNQTSQPGYGQQTESTYPGQGLLPYHLLQQNIPSSTGSVWEIDENAYPDFQNPYAQNTMIALPQHTQYRNPAFRSPYPHSPASNDGRRNQQSSYASSDGASSYALQSRAPSRGSLSGNVATGQTLALDRKLRGLQQEQQGLMPPHLNPMQFRPPFANPYDLQTQNALRMNSLPYYTVPPMANLLPQAIPRGPAKDQDAAHSTRSACLEEFRSNSKTNKRYELKDIYGHVVEFSGDQHGSRFIQQKLETANSDEKDQAFREILPNAMQLMTDVFGNYVIQKFFEHGNQSQKKILANQMKNHVLALSLQMYGCRVVQKALEHILTDQQASLIAELQKDKQVMRCVKDQNGNHVVQKAIERIPAEHIQFIVNAFTGQVCELSKHAYGCRVIQRMLEHCVEPTRTAVLQELHGCQSQLITDQYGNYVTQHVIEHGREEDRAAIITLVISAIIIYSKHKFASNVVERCIRFGTAEQRNKILDVFTAVNEKGDSNLQYLIRDQYCNYVIQTLVLELKGSQLDEFIETLKPQLAMLKRFSYGKQVQAIEALIYTTGPPPFQPQHRINSLAPPPIDTSNCVVPTPPPLTGDGQSPQSSSVPSTNASSVGAAADSRKSSTSNAVEVMTPTST
ncbi:MAG: hypothetical protein Q9169_005128 [Polycauliona sp. 2 TL-2023]